MVRGLHHRAGGKRPCMQYSGKVMRMVEGTDEGVQKTVGWRLFQEVSLTNNRKSAGVQETSRTSGLEDNGLGCKCV